MGSRFPLHKLRSALDNADTAGAIAEHKAGPVFEPGDMVYDLLVEEERTRCKAFGVPEPEGTVCPSGEDPPVVWAEGYGFAAILVSKHSACQYPLGA